MILDRRLPTAVTPDPRSSNWLEEPAVHYRCLARPGCGVSETRPARAAGRASRRCATVLAATRRGGRRIHRARTPSGSAGRRSAPGIAYLAFPATMPLTGMAVLLPYTARRR